MTDIATYWTLTPTDQGSIREQIEQEEAAAEAERKKVVGYFTTIEAPDSTMPTTERDRDVIVCVECYGDLPYSDWEPITKEEYLDKELIVYKMKCSECRRPLA